MGDAVRTSRLLDEATAPIERRKVYELVSERLQMQIGASLLPGDPLPAERELAERYGVGRSSVREALRMLESRGLIESRGNGAFVVAPERNPFEQPLTLLVADEDVDRAQLFEVRRILEAAAASLAARRRTPADLEAMAEAIEEMERALAVDAQDEYVAADIRYHLVISGATGNRLIPHLMQAIRERLSEMFGTVYHYEGGPAHSIAQHREITAAIRAQDAARASALMTDHIERVERELDELDRRGG